MPSGHKTAVVLTIVFAIASTQPAFAGSGSSFGNMQMPQTNTHQERKLRQVGLDADAAAAFGIFSCSPNASQLQLRRLVHSTNELAAFSKRDQLVRLALGYAAEYKAGDPRAKKVAGTIAEITGTGKANSAEAPDWCATFVEMLANQVDQRSVFVGAHNYFSHGGSSYNSGEFASASKLMQIFGPDPVNPSFFGGKRPKKISGAYLGPNKKPMPGCMAVYQERGKDGKGWGTEGHMVLVTAVNNDGTMETVEGNASPQPGSPERGIYKRGGNDRGHQDRHWGVGKTINYVDKETKVNHIKEYRGCILPWPGMASLPQEDRVCPTAVTQNQKKGWDWQPDDRLQDLMGLKSGIAK